MNLFGLDTAQVNTLVGDFSKKLSNFELRTKGLGVTINQTKKSLASVEKTSENANSFIDMGKHTLLGGLIGGAISAMTGIGGVMPIGALIGLGIGYDFNKFTSGELPIQNNKKPEKNSLLDLITEYAKFRLSSFMRQPSKPDETTTAEQPSKPDETTTAEQPSKPDETTTAEQPLKPDETTTAEQPSKPDETTTAETEKIEAKKLFSDSKLPTNLFTLPTKFLNTSDIINDKTINDTVFNTALENHEDWKSLTQTNGIFYGVTETFTDKEKNILKTYIKAELLRLHAEKQNKEEND